MSDPIKQATEAAKSAFSIRNIVVGFLVFAALSITFNALGWTAWLITPVDKAKAWNAARKAKTA